MLKADEKLLASSPNKTAVIANQKSLHNNGLLYRVVESGKLSSWLLFWILKWQSVQRLLNVSLLYLNLTMTEVIEAFTVKCQCFQQHLSYVPALDSAAPFGDQIEYKKLKTSPLCNEAA